MVSWKTCFEMKHHIDEIYVGKICFHWIRKYIIVFSCWSLGKLISCGSSKDGLQPLPRQLKPHGQGPNDINLEKSVIIAQTYLAKTK